MMGDVDVQGVILLGLPSWAVVDGKYRDAFTTTNGGAP
jgi:hypothetical protein